MPQTALQSAPTILCSQMWRATNCATPRFYEIFLKVVKYVVKRISDQDFRKMKSPWRCSMKGNVRQTALQSISTVLYTQISCDTNCATARYKANLKNQPYILYNFFYGLSRGYSDKMCPNVQFIRSPKQKKVFHLTSYVSYILFSQNRNDYTHKWIL